MPQKSTKHKTALQPSKHIDLLSKPGKATGWTASKAKKPKDTPQPSKEVVRDPASKELARVKPKARSTTVPQKSTKPKEASKFLEELGHTRDSKGQQVLVRSRPPSTTKTPSLTKHKDAGYDKSKGLATRRDRAGIITVGSVVEEAADDGDAAGPEAADREDSVDGSTTDKDSDDGQIHEGDTDEEDAAGVQTIGGGPAGREPAEVEVDEEYAGVRIVVEEEVSEAHTARRVAARRDDATAAGVEAPTSTALVRRGPGRTRPHDPRPYADGAYSAEVEAARRDNATIPATGVEAPTRDLRIEEPMRSHRARQHDPRDYAADRHLGSREHATGDRDRARRDNARGDAIREGVPTRESNRRDPHRRELVGLDYVFHDDDSAAIMRPGFERRVADESILDRMPPLRVGDDNFIANRNMVLHPDIARRERNHRLAPDLGLEEARNWSAEDRADWEMWISGRQRQEEQRHGGQHQGQGYQGQGYQGQGYQGQGYQGQGYQGQGYQCQCYQCQGYYGQVGRGSGGQNATRTMMVRSRDDPRNDPPPAYTPYDQTYTGYNRYH